MIADIYEDNDLGESMASVFIGDQGFKMERGIRVERSCNISAQSEEFYLPCNEFGDMPYIDW